MVEIVRRCKEVLGQHLQVDWVLVTHHWLEKHGASPRVWYHLEPNVGAIRILCKEIGLDLDDDNEAGRPLGYYLQITYDAARRKKQFDEQQALDVPCIHQTVGDVLPMDLAQMITQYTIDDELCVL